MKKTATVFNIQRFSLDDGPGIRTTVFLKGCNLHCRWCHNPESISGKQNYLFLEDQCMQCGACAAVCRAQVHTIKDGRHFVDRSKCKACLACVAACPAGALSKSGETRSVEEILQVILRDKDYYETSGGGVTFSGGEPMLQVDFLEQMLMRCKEAGLHTAVDTAGNVEFTALKRILPYVDLFLFDVKMADSEKHKQATGVGNERILENLKRLGEHGVRIWVRTPVIASVHTREDLEAIAKLLQEVQGIERAELLPYHKYGVKKYEQLGMPYTLGEDTPDEQTMEAYRKLMAGYCSAYGSPV